MADDLSLLGPGIDQPLMADASLSSRRLPGVDAGVGVGAATRAVVDGGLTPDEAAMREAWAKRFDMPLDTVNRNPDVVRNADITRRMVDLGATSPAMAEMLSDPKFLSKVYDVPEELSTFHKLVTSPWKITQAVASGLPALMSGAAGFEGMLAELQGKGRGARYYNAARNAKGYAEEVAAVDPNASTFEKWTAGAFQSLGQKLPPMMAGFAVGGPAGSAVALGAMGLTSTGASALKGHDAGLGAWRNAAFAGVDGAVEVASEMLPTIGLLKGLKAGSPLIPLFFKNQLQEQWTEQIATHLQDLNEWASIDRNKGKTFGEYVAERPVAALQTMYSTLVAGGGQVVIGKALEKVAYDRDLTERKALDAELTGTNLQNIVAAAEAGKVRARDNQAFGDFIQSVAAESGAAPEAVWVAPDVLMKTLEQAGLTVDEVKQAMPSLAEQLDDALVAGHDVRVPLGEFMANLPGTGLDAALIPFLRTEDANGELSMTQDEAKTFLQSDQAPKFLKEAERLVEEKLADDAFTTSRKVVEDSLVKQLQDTGRFTQDVNRAYGTIMSAFYSVQAHRLGITPEAMFAKYPINIAAQGAKRANQLDQIVRPDYAPKLPGEDLKTYMKRAIDTMPSPTELPYAPERFFAMNDGTQIVDIESIESSKSAEENTQGATNAPKRFLAAYHGVLKPRDAIAVQPLPGGGYRVLDGNGTFSAFKNYGWPSMPVNVFNSMEEFEVYEERRKKLEKLDFPPRPAWLSPELYKAIGDELVAHPIPDAVLTPEVRAEMERRLAPEIAKAEEAKPGYDAMMQQLAADLGALDVKLAPVKKIGRAAEKLHHDYKGDVASMGDLVRGTLVVSDRAAAERAFVELGARTEIVKSKNRFEKPTEAGYRDISAIIVLPNGIKAEIQINVPEMLQAKDVGHKLYEIERVLPKTDPLVPELQGIQTELYGAALAQYETRLSNSADSMGSPNANTLPGFQYGSGSGLNAITEPSGNLAIGTPSTSNNLEPAGISGLFDIGTSTNILSQSVNLRAGKETLARYGITPGKRHNTRDVAMALEARQRAKYGTIALDDRTDDSAKRISKWMVEEVQFAIAREGSGMGWYTTHFQAALDLFGDKYPELKTDQDARDMLTAIIAISSNGEDVVDNFRIADGVYANFRETGKLTMSKGSGRSETEGGLLALQSLYEKLGGAQQLKAYLLDTRKIKELAAIAKANGVEFKTAYPVDMTMPLAAVVLGPKLGAFYANLMGQTEYLTMDRWWSRLFNRYRGYTLEKPTQDGLNRFRGLTDTQGATDDQTLIDIVAPKEAYERRGWKTALEVMVGRKDGKTNVEKENFQQDARTLAGDSFMEMFREHQIEKAANTLYKAAFTTVRDAPENASDREFMVRTTKYAVRTLKRRGVDITPADLQAVLWYYEKRLYNELGTKDSGTYSYEDAARTVLRESGVGQPQGQLALGLEQGAADSGTGSIQPYTRTFEQGRADGIDLPATEQPARATADDFTPASIEGILGKTGWAFLTAENPRGVQATPEENAARMEELQTTLKQQGIEFVEVKGKYGQDENSILVLGIEPQQALELGKLFDQDSVLTRDGLIYQDGSVNPARKVTKFDTTPEDFYTTLPDGTKFQIDIDFDQRLALPKSGNRIGSVDVDAVHFSKTARNVLNGSAYGTGMKGAERAEVMSGDPRAKKRVHFYVPEGQGVQAEKDVGGVAHGARLTNLYDAEADPLKLWHSNSTNAAREAAVIDAGYSGYYARAVFGKQGTAVVFGEEPIMVEPLGDEKTANERLANSLPPPADYTPDKQLALRVVNNKGLPSGSMTIARWDAVIKAVDPELHARLEEKGAFDSESEEPLYRDELVKTFYQSAATPEQVLAKYPRITEGFQDLKLRRSRERIQSSADSAFDKNRIVPGIVELPFSDVTLQGEPTISTSPKELARIEALVEEIKRNGVIEPLFVGMHTDGFMYLMEGQHRARALKALGYTTFPARIAVDTTPGGTEKYLFQGEQARGQITFADDITTKPTVITLLEKADLSTFLHEMGHFQLEVLAHIAQQPGAPQGIVDDMSALMKWFGVKDITAWQTMTLEEKRPHHEKYARGFEAYLFEGKSPNQELAGVFSRFRAWMINVYKSLQNLNVQLTPEVRSVFGRMLATNEQITQTEQARGMLPSIKTKPKGMSDEEWQSFLESEQEATQSAVDKLQARSVRDLKWTTGARARAIKDLQEQAKEKRKQVGAEVAAEVNAMPIYAAQRFLRTGELPTENLTNAQRKILDTIAGMKLKMSLPVLKEMYGEGGAAPWRYLPQGTKNGLVAADGVSPETIAELFGFSSGDHLVREILAAESPKSVIEGMTDQRMLERYGDLSSMDAINKAADEAVHNEARIRFVATELAMLEGATSITQPTGKTVKYTNPKTGKLVEYQARGNVFFTMARTYARQMVAQKKVRDLRPNTYLVAEARAGKEAFDTKGPEKQMALKRTQLINMQAYKAAIDAQREIEKTLRYLKKVGDSESISADYREQIQALLEQYDLRQVSLTELDRRKSLREWYDEQVAQNPDNPPIIPEDLLNDARRVSYRDLSIEEFRGLADAVRNIEHLGKLKNKLLKARDARDFADAVDKLTTGIKDNATKTIKEELEHPKTFIEKAKRGAGKFFAMHVKFANTLRQMDGWKDNGIMYKMFGRGMNDSATDEAVRNEKSTTSMVEILNRSKSKMTEKTYIPEIKASLTREGRIMVALNTGTEGNMQRLMDGDTWTAAQVRAVVDTLTKEEMDMVQEVWDHLGTYRAELGALQKRLTGVEPVWIESTPVITRHGTYRGGYLPAKYDGDRSTRAMADEALADIMEMAHAKRGRPKTRDSMVKKRAAKVTNRPLRKDFGVVLQHISEVNHRIAWQEWVYDSSRLLNASAVDGAIREHYGVDTLNEMRDALEDIAKGDVGAQNQLERILNYTRTGATIAGLGWRVTTSLLQPIGLTQSMVRIGPKWVAKGMAQWFGDAAKMENTVARIYEKSDFMRLRGKTQQREINEIANVVKGKNSAIENSYFYMIQKMQMVADVPTWLGQYEKSITNGMNEADAIAQADQAVLDAQGGGQIKDLASIQRGGPLMKLFTNFYSFFNTTYNLTREAVGRTDFKSAVSVGGLAVDMLLLYTVPAVLGTLLKDAFSDKDEDEDKLLRKIIADQLNYLFGTVVLAREVGAAVNMAIGLPANYSGPAGLRIFGEIANFAKQANQGEMDEALLKAAAGTAGVLFHLPSGQVSATLDGVYSLATGKTENPGALLVGSSKQ